VTQTAWDRLAPIYDWQLPLERRAIAAALELAAPQSEDRLLDLATGTGAVLRMLARRAPRPAVAIGLDSSKGMLERVPPLPAGWRLERGDVTDLPFPPESFEVVIAAYLLHLLDVPSLERALGDVRRVLKPGGRFVTVTPVAPRSRLEAAYRAIVAGLGPISESSLVLRPMDPSRELARSGLVPVRGRYVRGGYPSLCILALAPREPPGAHHPSSASSRAHWDARIGASWTIH
jgi:ubiquinone/menaquinone biosynthesis C-methylase UbiE